MMDGHPAGYNASDEMHRLVMASLAGDMSSDQGHRLEELVRHDIDACDVYLNLVHEWSILLTWAGHEGVAGSEAKGQPAGFPTSAEIACPTPLSCPWVDSRSHDPPAPLPAGSLLATGLHGLIGYFSEGMPLSYLLATVITGVALLIGAIIPVSEPAQIARQPNVLPSPIGRGVGGQGGEPLSPLPAVVGRITAMVDCTWADVGWVKRSAAPPGLETNPKSHVALGDNFALASGLLEITYNTGAKVILQGPVTYEVESNGGFLSVGKLTGKLAKGNDEARMTKDEGLQNSSFVIRPSSFVIHTPTATVTDLGTEFGVEVTEDQQSRLHVFQGKIVLQPNETTGKSSKQVELGVGESATVGLRGIVNRLSGNQAAKMLNAATFVRAIPKRVMKSLSLVDLVAGGNGFGSGLGTAPACGIDCATGKSLAEQCPTIAARDDGRYHRAEQFPFLDGVFVPRGNGETQLDSAGHTFTGLPAAANRSAAYIWAGRAIPYANDVASITRPPAGGLQLWLKADAGVVTDRDTHSVNTWQDQSGVNGSHHATSHGSFEPQLASIVTPVNPRQPVVRFSGNHNMAFTLPNANKFAGFSVFAVVSQTGNTGYEQTLIGSGETSGVPGNTAFTPGIRWGLAIGGSGNSDDLGWAGPDGRVVFGDCPPPPYNTLLLMSWVKDRAGWTVRNGDAIVSQPGMVPDTSAPTGNFNGVIGSEMAFWRGVGPPSGVYGLIGDVAEILIYDRPVAGSELQQVNAYLNQRYATNLPDFLRGTDYSKSRQSVLSMPANKGITFDLEAIRRANPGCKILRFSAVAGNAAPRDTGPASGECGVWVFVDGQLSFRRQGIAPQQGVNVAVRLNDQSRFLSLVSTDGGDRAGASHVIFAEPRLQLAVVQNCAEETSGPNRLGGKEESR